MRICVLYVDAGGGHRATAMALKEVLMLDPERFQVTITSFFRELIPTYDLALRVLKISGENIYNELVLKGGLTSICWPILVPLYQWHLKYAWKFTISTVHQFLKEQKPDIIISVAPFINQYLYKIVRLYDKKIPLVTLLTDYDECHSQQWFDLPQHQDGRYYIFGTERLLQQAYMKGIKSEQVFPMPGLVISPRFYRKDMCDVSLAREKLGLNPNVPTALILLGGYAGNSILKISKQLSRCNYPIQAIFICGHNKRLAIKLKKMRTPYKKHVEGFTQGIEHFMQLADFFIGKPGSTSVSEALVMKLPVIVKCNQFTLRQERYVGQWITEKNFGTLITSFSHLAKIINSWFANNRLQHYRENLMKFNNRSVYEIQGILNNIIARQQALRNG